MKAIVVGFAVIATCWSFYQMKGKNFTLKNVYCIISLIILAIALYFFADKEIYRLNHLEPWDFPCFYLNGKVAVSGLNFYEPQSFYAAYKTIGFPSYFYQELAPGVLDVGFPYPPPTILYFAPLGLLSYNTALISWTIFNLCFVCGCLYLIFDQFLKSEKLNGLILTASLFFLFSEVKSTAFYSQTNFIVLFYLLLIKKYSDKKIAGIFLTLAIFTKPLMIIIGIFFLLKRKWRAVIYSIISAVAMCGLTFLLFGKESFLSYIYNNPFSRIPPSAFSDGIVQSLYAVLLRNKLITLTNPFTFMYITIIILLLTGIYLLFLMRKKLYDFILPILLLVGLLLYPATQSHYGVVLLFITFQFFNNKNNLNFIPYLNLFLLGAVYCLGQFSIFSCICFLLIILILKSTVLLNTNKPSNYQISNSKKLNLFKI